MVKKNIWLNYFLKETQASLDAKFSGSSIGKTDVRYVYNLPKMESGVN